MRDYLSVEEPLNRLCSVSKLIVLLEKTHSLSGVHGSEVFITHAVISNNNAQGLRFAALILSEFNWLLILFVDTGVGIHDLDNAVRLTNQKLITLWCENGSCEKLASLSTTFFPL